MKTLAHAAHGVGTNKENLVQFTHPFLGLRAGRSSGCSPICPAHCWGQWPGLEPKRHQRKRLNDPKKLNVPQLY